MTYKGRQADAEGKSQTDRVRQTNKLRLSELGRQRQAKTDKDRKNSCFQIFIVNTKEQLLWKQG